MSREAEYLSIAGVAPLIPESRGLSGGKITDILSQAHVAATRVSVEVIRQNMRETLHGVMRLFDDEDFGSQSYQIDEVQVSLAIGVEGQVSVMSSVSGAANTNSGVVVRLKRREEEAGHAK